MAFFHRGRWEQVRLQPGEPGYRKAYKGGQGQDCLFHHLLLEPGQGQMHSRPHSMWVVWMDGWLAGWMDGRIDEWVDR